jgi:hypothetical protein
LTIGLRPFNTAEQYLTALDVAHAPPLSNFGDAALATDANIRIIQGANIDARRGQRFFGVTCSHWDATAISRPVGAGRAHSAERYARNARRWLRAS